MVAVGTILLESIGRDLSDDDTTEGVALMRAACAEVGQPLSLRTREG